MWRFRATMLFLLAAGCAADNSPPLPPVPAASAPPISSAAIAVPRTAPAGAPAQWQGAGDDFDTLLTTIAASGELGNPATIGRPALTQPETPFGGAQGVQVSYGDNLEICLDGRWAAFCQDELLTAYDAAQVEIAEYDTIVAACLDPEQRQLCQLQRLKPTDVYRVRSAWLVTPDMQFGLPSRLPATPQDQAAPRSQPNYTQRQRPVTEAPAVAAVPQQPTKVTYQPPSRLPPVGYTPPCSESGSCYGDTSAATGRPKTTYVHGYFRKNGAYVRSYYRSHR